MINDEKIREYIEKCKEYSYQYDMKNVYILTINRSDLAYLSIGRNMQKKLQ